MAEVDNSTGATWRPTLNQGNQGRRHVMNASLHELTAHYVLIEGLLKTGHMSPINRKQIEVVLDEIGEEIVSTIRASMDDDEDLYRFSGTHTPELPHHHH